MFDGDGNFLDSCCHSQFFSLDGTQYFLEHQGDFGGNAHRVQGQLMQSFGGPIPQYLLEHSIRYSHCASHALSENSARYDVILYATMF